MIYAGIVAGGTGSRVGGTIPKQYLDINGCPMLIRTVKPFTLTDKICRIYIAVSSEWFTYAQELLVKHYKADELDRIKLIEGGINRNDSVMNIITAVCSDNNITDDDILITHDAARPFVTNEMIEENIRCASENTVCTTAIPVTDTIIVSSDGSKVDETPNRNALFQAQTPQTFKINALLEAYARLTDEQINSLTDICGIFSSVGKPVSIVKGSVENIKVTSPLDIKIAEAITE